MVRIGSVQAVSSRSPSSRRLLTKLRFLVQPRLNNSTLGERDKSVRIPVIQGLIERRILANYRIAPEVARRVIPAPFRPKVVHGYAIGGICLIRLRGVRPLRLPIPIGINSENCAHRFSVEWDTPQGPKEGVFIPRRDTSSSINALVGGRIFPGVHHRADFTVRESATSIAVAVRSNDGSTGVDVQADVAAQLSSDSIFPTLAEASSFFKAGSLGYSATTRPGTFDGLELRTADWSVQSLSVRQVQSTFFDDNSQFPSGSVTFDCALLMRDIKHEWHGREELREFA